MTEQKKVKIAFESEAIDIPIENLIPMKTTPAGALKSVKYKQILVSVEEQGIIEFPMVFPSKKQGGKNTFCSMAICGLKHQKPWARPR